MCWRWALVLYRMLPSGRGGDAQSFFGVQQEAAAEFEVHAWVELNGVAVDGTQPCR